MFDHIYIVISLCLLILQRIFPKCGISLQGNDSKLANSRNLSVINTLIYSVTYAPVVAIVPIQHPAQYYVLYLHVLLFSLPSIPLKVFQEAIKLWGSITLLNIKSLLGYHIYSTSICSSLTINSSHVLLARTLHKQILAFLGFHICKHTVSLCPSLVMLSLTILSLCQQVLLLYRDCFPCSN